MARMPDKFVDLTVTSPPYDNLRTYNDNIDESWNETVWKPIIKELHRVTKQGGVVVWVVGDKIKNGNKTLSSFKQAFYFQELGFNVHDVMIYQKKNTPFMRSNAYTNSYEFMFIFSKGMPNTFNPLKTKTARNGVEMLVANKKADGINKKVERELKKEKTLINIWQYAVGFGGTTKDKIAFEHPAVFPEQLAADHIRSWSNEGDTVYDPFMGSGTTAKMAHILKRNWIGSELSKEYVELANKRLNPILRQMTLF
jgi:site-specific DNA-methyltransferase (adenine-specific)